MSQKLVSWEVPNIDVYEWMSCVDCVHCDLCDKCNLCLPRSTGAGIHVCHSQIMASCQYKRSSWNEVSLSLIDCLPMPTLIQWFKFLDN